MDGVLFEPVDYRGRVYDRFYAARDSHHGPGWFVWGRNPEYGDRLCKVVARPNVAPRRYKHWNGRVRRGWATKAEAYSVAARLNAGARPAA